MQDLEQVKTYLMHILQKPANQSLLANHASLRDLHCDLEDCDDIDSIIKKLNKIAAKILNVSVEDSVKNSDKAQVEEHNRLEVVGLKSQHVCYLVAQILRMVKNADYLINHLGIPLVDEANAFKDDDQDDHAAEVSLFKNGIPADIYSRIENFSVVYLSGAPINPYGHALLLAQDDQERPIGYFHVSTLYDHPAFLTPDNFQRYLHVHQQEVVDLQHIPKRHTPRQNLTGQDSNSYETVDVLQAKEKLDDLCRKRWFWVMIKHNCLSFAKTVLKAGDYSCDELGGKNQAKRALNGRGFEGGLPLPRLRVQNVAPQFLDHHNYNNHIAKTTLEQAFIKKLKEERISEIVVDEILDPPSDHLTSAQKNGAFLRFVIHNTHQVLDWQTQIRADKAEDKPDESAASDILLKIKQMIEQTEWKIRFGGERVQLHLMSRTMKQILRVIDDEGDRPTVTRLDLIRKLAKSADAKRCWTRTDSVAAFYRNLIRSPETRAEKRPMEDMPLRHRPM